MLASGRRRVDLGDSSRMPTHAQSPLEIESPRARGPYTAGGEFSPAPVLRPATLQFERKRFHAAYDNVRGKDDPAKARKGCSTAITRAGMSTAGLKDTLVAHAGGNPRSLTVMADTRRRRRE